MPIAQVLIPLFAPFGQRNISSRILASFFRLLFLLNKTEHCTNNLSTKNFVLILDIYGWVCMLWSLKKQYCMFEFSSMFCCCFSLFMCFNYMRCVNNDNFIGKQTIRNDYVTYENITVHVCYDQTMLPIPYSRVTISHILDRSGAWTMSKLNKNKQTSTHKVHELGGNRCFVWITVPYT